MALFLWIPPQYFQGATATTSATGPGNVINDPVSDESAPVDLSFCGDEGDEEISSNVNIKVLSSSNKKAFTMYTLRGISVGLFLEPDSLREEIFAQLGGDVVSSKKNFHLGYFKKNVKLWINNKQDSKDACDTLKISWKTYTLWCIGLEKVGSK